MLITTKMMSDITDGTAFKSTSLVSYDAIIEYFVLHAMQETILRDMAV